MLKLAARARVIDELMAEGVNVALPVVACDIALTSAELTLVRMIDRMSAAGAARTSASADPGRPQPLATEG